MKKLRSFLAVPLAALMLLVVPSSYAFAGQRHAVDPSAVAATVAGHAATQDADRAALREALTRPEVRQMADRMGVDLGRVDASIDTMSGQDLERAASAARQVNDSLAGGASAVVISTTTIVIALLVVVLLIVALK